MSTLDVPVRDDDILLNPYALTDDLLPPSKLLEDHLFASDNSVFRRLLNEVSLICIGYGSLVLYIKHMVGSYFMGTWSHFRATCTKGWLLNSHSHSI